MESDGPAAKRGQGQVRALFFTDRAGYLRGTSRGAQHGPIVCEAMHRLMKHRQPSITLTHTLSHVNFERRTLHDGAKGWLDRQLTYSHVPAELSGATFFAGPHSTVPSGELLLSSPQEGYCFIWCEDKSDADGGIPKLGWDPVVIPEGSRSMSFGGGRTVRIFKKFLSQGSAVVMPVVYMWIGGVAFRPSEDPFAEGNEATVEKRPTMTSASTDVEPPKPSGPRRNFARAGSIVGAMAHRGSLRSNFASQSGAGATNAISELSSVVAMASGAPASARRASVASNLDKDPTSPVAASSRGGGGGGGAGARNILKHRTMTDTSLGSHTTTNGSWRVGMKDGRRLPFKHDEVVSKLSRNSELSSWPIGARWLQAAFWEGQKGIHPDLVYHYDALKTEPNSTHEGVSRNIVNHFERYVFLDNVADRNLVSSAPVLLSQHLSYHCGLELLSGDFEFLRDSFGQLWLVDAKNLLFIASARKGKEGNTGGGGGGGEETGFDKDPRKQTLPRYLSEEALRNLVVPDDTGSKCQKMTSLMHQHYKTMKVVSGMEDMLRKTDEVVEISIPVFEGTDKKAFARTFGASGKAALAAASSKNTARDRGGNLTNVGLAWAAKQQQLPKTPQHKAKVSPFPIAPEQRELPASMKVPKTPSTSRPTSSDGGTGMGHGYTATRARGPKRRGLGMPAWDLLVPEALAGSIPPGRTSLLEGNRRPSTPTSTMGKVASGASARFRPTISGSSTGAGHGSPASNVSSRSLVHRNTLRDTMLSTSVQEAVTTIEVVLADSAQKLLSHSGPGLRPDGPTLDICGPMSSWTPGVGLLERRQAARPVVRLVEVPPDAASSALPELATASAAQRKSVL